jgi:transcriptional regulator with XRE-family HTH domain
VQKYERGANRVSSGRLVRIAEILNVDILTLLGVTDSAANTSYHETSPLDLLAEPQALQLATHFAAIKDARLHRLLVAVTGYLADLSS